MTTGRINQKTIVGRSSRGREPPEFLRRAAFRQRLPAGSFFVMGSRAHPRHFRGAPSLDKVPPIRATRLPFQIFLPLESATEGLAGNQALPNRDMSGSGGAYRPWITSLNDGYPRRRYPYCVSRSSSQRPSVHNTQLRREDGASRA